jgi:hypothetical protein
MRAVVLLLVTCGLLTACGTSTPGTPVVAQTPTPTRPNTIDLHGKDPCILPQSDATRFQWESLPKSQTDEVFQVPECMYNSDWGAGYILFGTKEGINVWLDGKYRANIAKTTPILGFPAINVTIDGVPERCDVLVDVAPNEYLSASTQRDAGPHPTIPAQPCVFSREWAESAMQVLLTQH